MRQVERDLRSGDGDGVLRRSIENVNRDAGMFVISVIMIVIHVLLTFVVAFDLVPILAIVVMMSVIIVIMRVDEFRVKFLVAEFDQVAPVRTVARVSMSSVSVFIGMFVIRRRDFAELRCVRRIGASRQHKC